MRGDNDGCDCITSLLLRMVILMSPNTLISQGAEVNNGGDNRGWTALHNAASNGHLDVTKYLISQGAEVNTGR